MVDFLPKLKPITADLLPDLNELQVVSKIIAVKVAQTAIADSIAAFMTNEQLQDSIKNSFWKSEYRSYQRI